LGDKRLGDRLVWRRMKMAEILQYVSVGIETLIAVIGRERLKENMEGR